MGKKNSKNITDGFFLCGRKPIYTGIERFDPEDEGGLIAEVNSALTIHIENILAEDYLYWYRRGLTPIYGRTKLVRPEICNKLSENHAGTIVDFKNGYFLTQPATYVLRKDKKGENDEVMKLNEYLYRSGKQRADNKIIDWFHTVGKGVLFVQSNDDNEVPFVAYSVDPRCAFVVKSLKPGNAPVYGVNVVCEGNKITIDVSDDTYTYKLLGTLRSKLATPYPTQICTAFEVVEKVPNPLKAVPLIEYYYNSVQMGAFESVVPILDAINAIQSDRLDGLDQFIQSLLVFYNCELGTDDEGNPQTPAMVRAAGALFLKSIGENKADLKEISSNLNQTQTQVLVDYLYEKAMTICGMPNSNSTNRGSDARMGAALVSNGWYQADTMARNTEDLFVESNSYFDKIILRILKGKGLIKDLSESDIQLQFVRNETVNAQSKAQTLNTYLSAGLHPILALTKSGASNDPISDFEMSQDYLKMRWGDPENPDVLPSSAQSLPAPAEIKTPNDGSQSVGNTTGGGGVRSYWQIRNGKRVLISGYDRTETDVQ